MVVEVDLGFDGFVDSVVVKVYFRGVEFYV